MKKFAFFFLLAPILWGGVSLATDFCTTPCDTIDFTQMGTCEANFQTATDALNTKQKEINSKIADEEEILKTAKKEYEDCIQLARDTFLKSNSTIPLTQEQKIKNDCDSSTHGGYEMFVTDRNFIIAEYRDMLTPYRKEVACAKESYRQARLNHMADTTGAFDLENINVRNEKNLDLVNDATSKNNILNRVLKILTQVLGTFGVLMLVIGAYFMITSQGDESQLQKGKNIFFYTIVGLLIAFMSFILVQFVISVIFTTTG